MQKTILIIILSFFMLCNYSCTNNELNYQRNVVVGQVHFYTPNQTTQLYLFSKGLDFGSPTIINNFNDSIPIDTLLNVELTTNLDTNSLKIYEFILKKVDVEDPVAVGNILIEAGNISVETIIGTFEIETTFTELYLPNAVIKINE